MLASEGEDATLARMRAVAAELRVWLLLGSLCLKSGDADGRFVNRSFLVAPDGAVRARYDKIHMFDVDLDGGESYRESAAYRPGERAVLGEAAGLRVGMTICYDMRFPHLYRDLGRAGAEVLAVPAAFTVPTGRAHWHVLLAGAGDRGGGLRAGAGAVGGACGESRGRRGRPSGIASRSGRGGRCCSTWARGRGSGSWRSTPRRSARARARVPALGHDRRYAGPA